MGPYAHGQVQVLRVLESIAKLLVQDIYVLRGHCTNVKRGYFTPYLLHINYNFPFEANF